MLLNDLYRVDKHHLEGGILTATLILEPMHPIFGGHFPGQPVVPGVCMMQMVKELLETFVLGNGKRARLAHADHAKFLSLIDPRLTGTVEAELRYTQEGDIKVVARLYNETTTFFKYTAVFTLLS